MIKSGVIDYVKPYQNDQCISTPIKYIILGTFFINSVLWTYAL